MSGYDSWPGFRPALSRSVNDGWPGANAFQPHDSSRTRSRSPLWSHLDFSSFTSAPHASWPGSNVFQPVGSTRTRSRSPLYQALRDSTPVVQRRLFGLNWAHTCEHHLAPAHRDRLWDALQDHPPVLPAQEGEASLSLQNAERAEHRRWQNVWLDVVSRAGTHASALVVNDSLLDRELVRAIFYHAPSTLARHARYWLRFEAWCNALDFPVYPPNPLVLSAWLKELVDGQCGKTVPKAVRDSCSFCCRCLGMEEIHSHPLVLGIDETHRRANGSPVKQAPPLSPADVIALEELAADTVAPALSRWASCCNLVLVYAGCRFDDVLHTKGPSLKLGEKGLEGCAYQTKTDRHKRGTPWLVPRCGISIADVAALIWDAWLLLPPSCRECDYIIFTPAWACSWDASLADVPPPLRHWDVAVTDFRRRLIATGRDAAHVRALTLHSARHTRVLVQ